MMRMANGEIDNASGSASCTSIKNSSEDLELYFIVVSLTLHDLVLVFINYYFYYPCSLPRFKYRPISGYQISIDLEDAFIRFILFRDAMMDTHELLRY